MTDKVLQSQRRKRYYALMRRPGEGCSAMGICCGSVSFALRSSIYNELEFVLLAREKGSFRQHPVLQAIESWFS
jgi:hypothetical protein